MATKEEQTKPKDKKTSSDRRRTRPKKSTKNASGRSQSKKTPTKASARATGARKRDSLSSGDERITLEPGKRSGQPCIRGLRITVADILDYLASGMSIDEILADFPSLEREDILAALRFAANRERAIVTVAK